MTRHWSEPQPDITERLNRASVLSAISLFAFASVYMADVSVWIAGPIFLAGRYSLRGGWPIFGYWKTGLAAGLLLGTVYLVPLFISDGPSGGHYPGIPGWPIMIPRSQLIDLCADRSHLRCS